MSDKDTLFDNDADFINNSFAPSTIDLDVDNEPNQPLPSKPDEADEFDRLLDDFINSQLQDVDDSQNERAECLQNAKPLASKLVTEDDFSQNLFPEERRLYDAMSNFIASVANLAESKNMSMPATEFSGKILYPRFRPKKAKSISQDIVTCWNVMLEAEPVRLSSLPMNASDEQILEFAEKTTNENLQMSLISYVESLIEIEGCEIAYNMRKAKAEKRKIERRIYEEHQQRIETMKRYVKAIEEQHFPINAERLVSNYFKTARHDPEGAKKMLENNPATFAPIEVNKIPPRFFGMIKPKPEDGIRINKEIGRFLKNLRA